MGPTLSQRKTTRCAIQCSPSGISLITTGCNKQNVSTRVNSTADRNRKLSVLAASEATRIADADSRLTRQLNIADQVIVRFGQDDAHAVLSEATKTLHEVAPKLGSHARISGWVSVSQLARKAMGMANAELGTMAKLASTEAQRELEALPDVGERCQYVLGVAEEMSQFAGEGAAIDLLNKGGEWAKGIANDSERRSARLAFAVALFNLNAYEGGVATLRGEEDATWSSDTMLALASMGPDRGDYREPSGPVWLPSVSSKAAPAAAEPSGVEGANTVGGRSTGNSTFSYGRALGYDKVFRGATNSRTAY